MAKFALVVLYSHLVNVQILDLFRELSVFLLDVFLLSSVPHCPTRHLCRPCHNREKARGLGKYICQKCHAIIEEQHLLFKNDPYHPDHFNCNNCG